MKKDGIKKSCYNFMTLFGLLNVSQLKYLSVHLMEKQHRMFVHIFRVVLPNATPWMPELRRRASRFTYSNIGAYTQLWLLLNFLFERHLFHFILFCHPNWYVYDNWMSSQSEFSTKLEFCVRRHWVRVSFLHKQAKQSSLFGFNVQ